jgi:hypothetical protein
LVQNQFLIIKDWDEHNQWAKRKQRLQKDAQRKRESRGKSEDNPQERREEKSRVEKKESAAAPFSGLPGWQSTKWRAFVGEVMDSVKAVRSFPLAMQSEKHRASCAAKVAQAVRSMEMTKMTFEQCVRHHESGEPAGEGTSYGQSWGQFAGKFDSVAGRVAKGKRGTKKGKVRGLQGPPPVPDYAPPSPERIAEITKPLKEASRGNL